MNSKTSTFTPSGWKDIGNINFKIVATTLFWKFQTMVKLPVKSAVGRERRIRQMQNLPMSSDKTLAARLANLGPQVQQVYLLFRVFQKIMRIMWLSKSGLPFSCLKNWQRKFIVEISKKEIFWSLNIFIFHF